jgi:uncharacterized membrane protein YeaQ/YmgE (transglycosylase-associated protein family)
MEPYMTWVNENWALVIMIINGLVAGWLAGLLLGGGGLIRNLVVGLIGAVVGGWLMNNGYLPIKDYYDFDALIRTRGNQIAASTIGAILVVIIARFLGGR